MTTVKCWDMMACGVDVIEDVKRKGEINGRVIYRETDRGNAEPIEK